MLQAACGYDLKWEEYIGVAMLSVSKHMKGRAARKGLRKSPRSPLAVFLSTALCSTAYKLEFMRITALDEGQERR